MLRIEVAAKDVEEVGETFGGVIAADDGGRCMLYTEYRTTGRCGSYVYTHIRL